MAGYQNDSPGNFLKIKTLLNMRRAVKLQESNPCRLCHIGILHSRMGSLNTDSIGKFFFNRPFQKYQSGLSAGVVEP